METNHRRKMQAVRCALASGSAWIVLLACADVQAGGPCTPRSGGWSEEFASCLLSGAFAVHTFRMPGTGEEVALLGGGIGGYPVPGTWQGQQQVCRRESMGWRSIGSLLPHPSSPIVELAMLPVGSGEPILVAITGVPASWSLGGAGRVFIWDGASWERVGQTPNLQWFSAAAVFQDDLGSALYVVGPFCEIDGKPICHLARWRGPGHEWESVAAIDAATGTARLDAVRTLDRGTGPALYIGGRFDSVDSVSAVNIARWDGASTGVWTAPGGGLPPDFTVASLATYDAGDALLAGGALGINDAAVYRLVGGQWSRMGGSVGMRTVRTLVSGQIDGTERLFAAPMEGALHEWDGSDWGVVHSGRHFAAAIHENDGRLLTLGHDPSEHPARSLRSWTTGAGWEFERTGMHAAHAPYHVTGVEIDGVRSLYIGGLFHGYNEINSYGGLRWDGESWNAFGDGLGFQAGTEFDDGSGPALYGRPLECIEHGPSYCNAFGRWDGEQWVAVIPGAHDLRVRHIVALEDDSGPALYFTQGPRLSSTTGPIWRWDGSGLDTIPGPPTNQIWTLAVFDDGVSGGAALYAGGANLYRWDGVDWELVGGGVWRAGGAAGTVHTMQAQEGGHRPGLYISGLFELAGSPSGGMGVPVNHVARWDGTRWSAFGSGLPNTALHGGIAVLSDPSGGPAQEILIGKRSRGEVHRWDGTQWKLIADDAHAMYELRAWDDGRGPSAWTIGKFHALGGIPSHKIGRYVPCLCYANCDGSTAEPVLNIDDVICFINRFSEAQSLPPEQQINHYANCDGSTTEPILTVSDFMCFINEFAAGCP